AAPQPSAVAAANSEPAALPEPSADPSQSAAPDVAPEPKPLTQTAALTPGPAGGATFLWPLRGKVLSAYGPKKGGEHNDGINIEAARGEPVRAAADGTVIYAGNELRGFGNLILIKHAGGWTTAYAHNDTLLVANGAQVKRGQVIAKAGSTGNVSSPQLHFELRRGTRAVNPGDYLTAGTDVPSVSRVAGQAAPPGLE
ncbi:MAG TPA: peptidoglycan DD-metalloendopeptidase family protein, partial [Alphaproteobacteria bacterium]|nr:peptidoglycan DD-metalloendopeptidase family protein [Alphaproteobacteria bacterium]